MEAFERVTDSRMPRGVRYPQASVLALCVVAFLCGRQNLTQVMRFGNDHRGLLAKLRFRRDRAPSVPTLSRVLGAVSVNELQHAVGQWFAGLVNSARKRKRCMAAAVDGKTSRASGVHVLNVFLHDVNQVVWQSPVDKKKNEITAFKEILDNLFKTYPFLRIVTGDAMFAGAPLCSSLIERGRHYVFQVKSDQPHLHEKMELLFAAKLNAKPDERKATGEKKKGLYRHS